MLLRYESWLLWVDRLLRGKSWLLSSLHELSHGNGVQANFDAEQPRAERGTLWLFCWFGTIHQPEREPGIQRGQDLHCWSGKQESQPAESVDKI